MEDVPYFSKLKKKFIHTMPLHDRGFCVNEFFYNRSSPEIFKNPSTGLKLTKIRLDLVEKSRDQVKIEARMAH